MKISVLIRQSTGSGGSLSKVIKVKNDYCLIGRENADILLEDAMVSKVHAVLFQDEYGNLFVRDLASTNGIYVRKEKGEQFALKVGSAFQIGRTQLTILSVEIERPKENVVVNRWPEMYSALPKWNRKQIGNEHTPMEKL